MKPRPLVPIAFLGTALLLAACGSSLSGAAASSKNSSNQVKNLVVTNAQRQSLLDAAAAYHQLPAKDYTGLQKGNTYLAFDGSNHTYYAAAGLVPSSKSLQAQIGTQDDGSYNLFTKKQGKKNWIVYNDGQGAVPGSKCPITIPASVVKVWNWKKGSCYPPN
jgi:hypothetical protein